MSHRNRVFLLDRLWIRHLHWLVLMKYIIYRKLHNIDTLEYSNDLHKLTIIDYDNTDATAKHIQQHLTTILDKNAPLRTTKVHLRSTNAWWNTELSELHRIIRKKELIWRKKKHYQL